MIQESKQAIKAICSSSKLSLGKIALLNKFKCGVLRGEIDDIESNIIAIYIHSQDYHTLVEQYENIKQNALLYGDSLSVDEYRNQLESVIDSINAFYNMLPRQDEASKKKQDSAME